MRMKKVRIILLSAIIVISLLFSSTAYAQGEELPDPGITPDSPFYFLDIWGKWVGLFFTFGDEAKAKKSLEYAEERLAEVYAMAVKKKLRGVQVATADYDEYMSIALERIERAWTRGIDIADTSELAALATSKHLFVLDEVMEIVPEEAKEAIVLVREVSIKRQTNVLRALAKERPERAMEINLAAIEGRLNIAREKAEENEVEEVEDALDEFNRLSELGKEIPEIARELGKDTTTVELLVAEATSAHLEALAEVYEKVPDQAKPAIERAMETSVEGYERAVEALKAKGALGEVPEETVLPEGLPEEIKEKLSELRGARQETSEEVVEEVKEEVEEEVKVEEEVEVEVEKEVTIEDFVRGMEAERARLAEQIQIRTAAGEVDAEWVRNVEAERERLAEEIQRIQEGDYKVVVIDGEAVIVVVEDPKGEIGTEEGDPTVDLGDHTGDGEGVTPGTGEGDHPDDGDDPPDDGGDHPDDEADDDHGDDGDDYDDEADDDHGD